MIFVVTDRHRHKDRHKTRRDDSDQSSSTIMTCSVCWSIHNKIILTTEL